MWEQQRSRLREHSHLQSAAVLYQRQGCHAHLSERMSRRRAL